MIIKRIFVAVCAATALFSLTGIASASDPTDKMAELGLTPDGQIKQPVTAILPATPKIAIPVYDRSVADYAVVSVDVPQKFSAAKSAISKSDTIMQMILEHDAALLNPGTIYDGAVQGADESSVIFQFTLPADMTDYAGFVTGDGLGISGVINDCIFGNLAGTVMSVQLKWRKNAQSEYVSLDDLAPEVFKTEAPFAYPDELLDPNPELDSSDAPGKLGAINVLNTGARPTGMLSGKAVYLNQGHGKVWRGTGWQAFSYQRGFLHNNMEDMSNADLMNNYVTPYMWAAGADTYSVRETDPNPNMVIVDNDDTVRTDGYGFSKTGTWTVSTITGFKNGFSSYTTGVDPHSQGTIDMTATTSAAAPTATATWAAVIPTNGWYNVYVSHAAYSNRPATVKYQVYHAGGVTDCTIDQRRWRNTWVLLGRFYFEKNAAPANAKVVLSNVTGSNAQYISADAVRWGGGRGVISRGTAGTSGEPRINEEARYHLQFMGVPSSGTDSNGYNIGYNASTAADSDTQVDEKDGWSARPRFARWMKDEGSKYGAPAQDSCMIASHSNALNGTADSAGNTTSDGTARGFGTYRNAASTAQDVVNFQSIVHPAIINALRGVFSASPGPLANRSQYSGNYGENSPDSAGMPIMLGEWLFHDNSLDMQLYHHPRFKQILARGIQRGIIDYWTNKGTASKVYSPEPIENLCVLQESTTTVRLTWSAPPTAYNGYTVASAATGYRIWKSEHGRAFPNALATIAAPSSGAPTYLVTGLTPGKNYYFKVTATNAGGESLGGDTLAVRTESATNAKKILIVQGFNKLDPSTRVKLPYNGGTIYRQLLDRMNTYDYIFEHMNGIGAYAASKNLPIKVDSCNKTAIEGRWVLFGGYDAVIWMSGIEAEVATWDCWNDTSIGPNSRGYIADYLNTNGKAFFLNGAEVAWEMVSKNVAPTFLTGTMKTGFSADGSGVFNVSPVAGSIFDGLGSNMALDTGSDWTRVGYQVQWPDVLTIPAGSGSVAALSYGASGNSGTSVDTMDEAGGWKHPSYSGSTNIPEAATETNSIFDTTTKYEGSASMKVWARWGTGAVCRIYDTTQAVFTFGAGDTLSYWVYGDNTNSTIAIIVRDSENELFMHPPVTLNFTGWKKLSWKNGDPMVKFAGTGDGLLTAPVKKDSFVIYKDATTPVVSNTIWFDDIRVLTAGGGGSTSGPIAATQYGTSSSSRIVFMGFPLEGIVDDAQRSAVMGNTAKFLLNVGALQVNLQPTAAVSAGAKWSIDGGVTWNNSETRLENVYIGRSVTVKFKSDVSGWTAPADVTFTLGAETPHLVTASYLPSVADGELTVTIAPAAAVSAGAQWNVDGGAWQNSGATVTGLAQGAHTVSFNTLSAWNKPTDLSVNIVSGQLTSETGTYTQKTGSLIVNITPQDVVFAGAKWNIDGGAWLDSGQIASELTVGSHNVSYKQVSGWETPYDATVTITDGNTTMVTGTYQLETGLLQVDILPAAAVSAGAKWSINGSDWNDSGSVLSNLIPGNYTVTFKNATGYNTPAQQSATVSVGSKTTLSATYTVSLGFDLVLDSGNFTAGIVTPLAPDAAVDISWNVSSTELTGEKFWCEVFASKSGGFDQVRFGSTMTNSYRQTGLQSLTQTIAPTNQTLKTLPDGVYSMMPVVNRGTISGAISENNYVNNWDTIAGKRIAVRNPAMATVDLKMMEATLTKDTSNPNKVTVAGRVKNVGTTALVSPGCWIEAFHGTLTAEATLDPQGTISAGQLLNSLDVNAETTFSLTGYVTAGVDNRALAVIVDSTDIVPETNEVNNNILWYQPAILPSGKDNGVDLAITSMSIDTAQLAPNQVKPGNKLKLNVTLQNKGTSTPADKIWLEVFASQDGGVSFMRGATATTGDRVTVPAAGTSQTYALEQTLNAIGDGMYTLVPVINRAGVGSNPGDVTPLDNRKPYADGRISLSTPSIAGTQNIAWLNPPTFTQNGTKMTVSGTVVNTGNVSTRSFWIEAFVGKLDNVTGWYTRESPLTNGVLCNGLESGAIQTVTISGTVPSGKVVGVLADSTDLVAETDETDNYDYSNLTQ